MWGIHKPYLRAGCIVMLIATPVIAPDDRRFFTILYPWLAADEIIIGSQMTVYAPAEDTVGLLTLSAGIAVDGKSLTLQTNPYVKVEGPPLEGLEYLVDILVTTSNNQQNKDSIRFIIDEGAFH